MKQSAKMKVPLEKVRELAERCDEDYAKHIAAGFTFMASSGFWITRSNGITARFVYRRGVKRSQDGRITHTTIITGIRP